MRLLRLWDFVQMSVYPTYPHSLRFCQKKSFLPSQKAHTIHHSDCVLYTVQICVPVGPASGYSGVKKEKACQPDIVSSYRHTYTHLCPNKKKRYSVAILPKDTLTVQDLYASTLLMRGTGNTGHRRRESESRREWKVRREVFLTEWCMFMCCACACVCMCVTTWFWYRFYTCLHLKTDSSLSLSFSLGICDEFSLENFLINPVSGLVYDMPCSPTHTHTHHTYAQALDESDSVSNEGISVYNKHGEDPLLGTQWKKQT